MEVEKSPTQKALYKATLQLISRLLQAGSQMFSS